MLQFFKTTLEAHFSKPRLIGDRAMPMMNRRASIVISSARSILGVRAGNALETAFGFSPEITALVNPMIEASLEVLQKVQAEFLSTPGKAHYVFSVKTLQAVFHGMLRVRPGMVERGHKFVRLWIHEFLREFGDRLNSKEELQRLT